MDLQIRQLRYCALLEAPREADSERLTREHYRVDLAQRLNNYGYSLGRCGLSEFCVQCL